MVAGIYTSWERVSVGWRISSDSVKVADDAAAPFVVDLKKSVRCRCRKTVICRIMLLVFVEEILPTFSSHHITGLSVKSPSTGWHCDHELPGTQGKSQEGRGSFRGRHGGDFASLRNRAIAEEINEAQPGWIFPTLHETKAVEHSS